VTDKGPRKATWIERWLSDLTERLRGLSPADRREIAERAAGGDSATLGELTAFLTRLDTEPVGGSPDSLLPSGGALAGGLWERLAVELAEIEPSGTEIVPGQQIGRYVVLHPLGSGGMGSVHAAYDPELDRQVAVKVLREDLFAEGDPSHEWLRHEAQALARLSHPNVVTVHDVGTSGGRLFLAMERIDGLDLRKWLADRKPAQKEILAVFRAIGRGLAAAHGAGLVHRDFKPQNVVIGHDGRPRILDFGVALAAVSPADSTPSAPSALSDSQSRPAPTVGTPAYMAPEQLEGGRVDARSDQYAFCLTLWEALYGERPFAGDSLAQWLEARKLGELPPPTPGSSVPPRLRRVLERGLAPAPDDRFGSMEELVGALGTVGPRRRWQAAALVALLGSGVVAWSVRDRAPACRGASGLLAGVWDTARRSQVASAFDASGTSLAGASLERVVSALDRWSEGWVEMRKDACEATRVRGEQSEELLDLRVACLDRRRDEARAIIDLLATADAATITEAPRAVLSIAPIAVCADPRLLTAPAPPPTEPAQRDRLADLERRLAQAKALRDLGDPTEATAATHELLATAAMLGDGGALGTGPTPERPPAGSTESPRWSLPLIAESRYLLADLEDLQGEFDAAEGDLFLAWEAALRGGHDEYVARSLNLLIWLDGNDRGDLESARRWARVASATLDDIDAGALLRADFHSNLGSAMQTGGLTDEAFAEHQRALALRSRLFGPQSYESAKSLNNLGSTHYAAARFSEALDFYRRALEIIEPSLGEHPATALSWSNVGSTLAEIGEPTGAREAHYRALEIRTRLFGADSLWVAITKGNIGFANLIDRPADAPREFEAMRKSLEASLPADHPYQAFPLSGLGRAFRALGRPAEAIPLLERALSLWESSGIALPHDLAADRFALARALWQVGRERERSVEVAKSALATLATLEASHLPLREEIRTWLAERGAG
jgi:eukaryotic-like serine/threonine-protein kinase